jgi:hypothetical protein
VNRGLTAPKRVIVHGRQIVVDQRIAMHALERRSHHQGAGTRHVKEGRGLDHQEWPQSLAAPQTGVAHGIDQPLRAQNFALDSRRRQQPVEQRLDVVGGRGEPRHKRPVRLRAFPCALHFRSIRRTFPGGIAPARTALRPLYHQLYPVDIRARRAAAQPDLKFYANIVCQYCRPHVRFIDTRSCNECHHYFRPGVDRTLNTCLTYALVAPNHGLFPI